MMHLSNFEFFSRSRKIDNQYLKCVQYLESQIKALREYHTRLEHKKGTSKTRKVIRILISRGESLLDNAKKKIGE